MEFDESVGGFGAAVAGAVGVEVAEELAGPLFEGSAQAGDLGDGAAWQAVDDCLGQGSASGQGGLVIDGADLLGASVGQFDFDVLDASGEGGVKSGLLSLGEVLVSGAQDVADPVQQGALRPRWPRVSCCTRRRTSSTAWLANFTTWKASRTARASSRRSSMAFLYPWNGSRVATVTPLRKL